MAMLAETRRRRNYTLVPKGKALYEDSDRFGTKMLEKMGWSKGKGLGANEDGEKDFVRIRYKRDNEGFGFEARDDQWTQHEKEFTGLLKNLHGENEEDDADTVETPSVGFGFQGTQKTKASMKEKLSGKSLVEMSKTSRARVHYQKFARMKDLSRASEKDLANIFGRKAPTEEDNIFSSLQAVNNIPEEEEKKDEEEEKKGVQIVNTGISITDYFKQKMEAFKLKRSGESNCDEVPSKKIKSDESENSSSKECEVEKPKKKKKKDKIKEDEEQPLEEEKPKKKKKRDLEELTVSEENPETAELLPEISPTEEKIKKKKKKSKEDAPLDKLEPQESETPSEENFKKQKKDSKEALPDPLEAESEEKPKKKKKKSKQETLEEEPLPEVESIVEKPKKKKKKSKEDSCEKEEEIPDSVEESKKKKKKSELESENKSSTDDEASSQVQRTDKEPTPEKEEDEGEWQQVKSKKEKKVDPTPESEKNQPMDDPKRYKINSYVAERFRNIDMPAFLGSNLSQFKGYGLDNIEQLEVYKRAIDDFKIQEFWKKDLIVFDDTEMREEFVKIGSHAKSANELLGISNYRRKVNVARKEKQKIPKLNLGAIKKRRAFTGI